MCQHDLGSFYHTTVCTPAYVCYLQDGTYTPVPSCDNLLVRPFVAAAFTTGSPRRYLFRLRYTFPSGWFTTVLPTFNTTVDLTHFYVAGVWFATGTTTRLRWQRRFCVTATAYASTQPSDAIRSPDVSSGYPHYLCNLCDYHTLPYLPLRALPTINLLA